jgi:hypothetical protein
MGEKIEAKEINARFAMPSQRRKEREKTSTQADVAMGDPSND